jgi:CubicO group peptidase (beta-lactamase class C family)
MWRTRVAALVAGSLFVAACGAHGTDDPPPDEAVPACDPAFERWEDAGFSGSVAIAHGDRFECLGGYGPADRATDTPNTPETVFAIGSVSKAFTAAAVLDLVDAGRLVLTDRAGDLVPGLTGPAAGATVRQLLLHTSGLTGSHARDDHAPLTRDQAVAAMGRLELAVEPGTGFLYSNAGHTLLALIVESASGRDYRQFLADEILPLPGGGAAGGFWDGDPAAPGPRAVGYVDEGPTDEMGDFDGPHWALTGNGDLAMTMRDLASWTRALFTGRIIHGEGLAQLRSLRFDHGDGSAEAPGWVASDAATLGEPFLMAAGGGGDIGHEVVVAWLPGSERIVAIASNTAEVTAGELLRAVGPALAAGDRLPAPQVVEDVGPDAAAAVAGTYRLDSGGTFDVTGSEAGPEGDAGGGDGRLAIAATGTDAVAALFPPPAGTRAEDIATHERDVLALLRGETQAGRDERAALESELGPLDGVELAGTVVDDGEMRTYVRARSASGELLAWYALDDQGGVGAAEIRSGPPTLLLGRSGGDFRPDDPTRAGSDVTVAFDGPVMAITGPAGPHPTITARLAR